MGTQSTWATACTFGAENVSSIKLFDNPVPKKFVQIKNSVKNVAKSVADRLKDTNTNNETDSQDKNKEKSQLKKPLFKFTSTTKILEFSKSKFQNQQKNSNSEKPQLQALKKQAFKKPAVETLA